MIDDQDDYTIPCPKCGEDIFDDVDQCPYCREYLTAADFKKPMPIWVVIIVILTIISMMLWSII